MPNSTMTLEIRAAPAILRAQAARWQREANIIRQLVADRPKAVLVGRGSSGNVCSFAAYVFALQTGLQPVEFRPWLTTQSLPEADWSDSVVYAFSCSGNSTDVAASAEWLRARGAIVVAISEASSVDVHLLPSAHHVIRLGCGPELSAVPTKSVIAELFVAAALAGVDIEHAAEQTASCMESIDATGLAKKLATFLDGARTVTWLARGPSVGAAMDAALKLQQCVGLPSFGYSMAEYLHGPIAAARADDRILFFSGADEPMDSKQALTSTLLARAIPFLCLGSDQTPDAQLPLPFPDARWARTVLLAYIAQLTCVELMAQNERHGGPHSLAQKVIKSH
jgi:glucosamine--fructose-6-phosphate aminotransferase (isomerizing)